MVQNVAEGKEGRVVLIQNSGSSVTVTTVQHFGLQHSTALLKLVITFSFHSSLTNKTHFRIYTSTPGILRKFSKELNGIVARFPNSNMT